ncbi:putative amidohydrolase YhaA [Paenibacillus sp. J31TS4]|nr:putative amidohydrolase YhaA [Paenibacillus sp. J31TS4]
MEFGARLMELYPDMVAWRRHLHKHPELSYQERATSQFAADRLEAFGLEVRRNVGGHGIVARLRSGRPGPVVALRADMDALPIQDEKECEYASAVPGVMHACGHDAHTAVLLAVAKLLAASKEELIGDVVFLFQPAEETTPGGAMPMIRDGALEGVHVIYGVHLWSPLPTGEVRSLPGPMMAAADEFTIEIVGKGGHGGLPHETVDAIAIGSQLVVALQTIVSRNVDPTQAAVVSVGSFHAGSSFNVIADRCVMTGTVRTFREEVRELIKGRLQAIVSQTCAMHGASFRLDYKQGYPPLVNDERETERALRLAGRLFGEERADRTPLIMAAEDFAYYLNKVPGCFLLVGAGNQERSITAPHHHPRFDIDEEAMLTAARLLAELCLEYQHRRG